MTAAIASPEFEAAALATITAHPELAEQLNPSLLFLDDHRAFLTLVRGLIARGVRPEPATLIEAAEAQRSPLSATKIFDIAAGEHIRANFGHYLATLRQLAERRRALDAARGLLDRLQRNGEAPGAALADFWETCGRAGEERSAAAPFTSPISTLLAVRDEPVRYLVDKLLVAGACGWIGGEPKSLKSWLALYLVLCVTTGAAVCGRYAVPQRARVLYLQEEDGARRIRRRTRQILEGLGQAPPEDALLRYSVKAGLLLDEDKWVESLRREMAAFRPALVVCDVFETLHTKDSSDRAELKPIFYTLDRLREEFDCGFLLVDHFKKASVGTSKRGGQRLAGSVAKHAWGENSLYLFQTAEKHTVRVEGELKDGPSEVFDLTLEDTPAGGVVFTWAAADDDHAGEMKGKILDALGSVAYTGEWATAKLIAEAAGVSPNTAVKWLNLLVDEDGKLEREQIQSGKVKPWHWRVRA